MRTDLLLLLYGAPGRFVERRLTNISLYLYLYVDTELWVVAKAVAKVLFHVANDQGWRHYDIQDSPH